MSKLKHIQRYMTSFELNFSRFERYPQSEQISITFTSSMELIFETIEIVDIGMNQHNSIIEPIVNRNFGYKFHHQNRPNQRQHISKNSSQQYQHSTTRQQYYHIKTGKQNQHRNPNQKYQPRYFQRPRTTSIPYLK